MHARAVAAIVCLVSAACAPDWDALNPSMGGNGGNGGNGGDGNNGNDGGNGNRGNDGGNGNRGNDGNGGVGGSPMCEPIIDGDDCTEDLCQDGVPANPQRAAGAPCNQDGGKVCSADGVCVDCFDPAHCSGFDTCGGGGLANVCGCTPTTCLTLGSTCGMQPDGCGGTLSCDNGVTDNGESDVDCGGPNCAAKCPQGKMCAVAADCTGNTCVDGFCCAAACNGTCRTCAGATPGTCSNVAQLLQDPDTCSGATVACNGGGQCRAANGQPCTANTLCASGVCDGATSLCI